MKTTYIPNKETIEKKWVHIDAKGKTLGRLAVSIANVLRGKNKPTFTPHVDCGDFVVVTNADKFVITGKKMEDKIYASHSGYPGGFKKRTLRQMLEKSPEKILEKAVKGMLPHNRLGAKQFAKLNVYTTDSHPHAAQQPKTLELSERGELLNNG